MKKDIVIGYILDANGKYDEKEYFENTPENISDFILNNQFYEIIITDVADNLILKVLGGFVTYCPNQDYLKYTLLPVLVSKQLK